MMSLQDIDTLLISNKSSCLIEVQSSVFFQGTLEDGHVVLLSQKITSGEQLRLLGINALGLKSAVVETALYDHRTSIREATYQVVSTWLKQQENASEAYTNLITSLQRCQMNQLANELVHYETTLPETSLGSTSGRYSDEAL